MVIFESAVFAVGGRIRSREEERRECREEGAQERNQTTSETMCQRKTLATQSKEAARDLKTR